MYSAQHESISDAELRLTFPVGPGSRYRVDLANLGPIATCDGPGWIGSGDEETSNKRHKRNTRRETKKHKKKKKTKHSPWRTVGVKSWPGHCSTRSPRFL